MQKPVNADKYGWLNINDVPTDQRASLYTWLEAYKLTRYVHSPYSTKKNELDLALGCEWRHYVKWYLQWDGNIIFPSMPFYKTGESLSIIDCDERLIEDDSDSELFALRVKLFSFMIEPYRHERVKLDTCSRRVHTWDELEKDLEDTHQLMLKNRVYSKNFLRLKRLAKTLTDGLLETHYNYVSKYDGKAS